jgi:hypothetical protein
MMDNKTKAEYERAAVALLAHRPFQLIYRDGVAEIARKAFDAEARRMGMSTGDLCVTAIVCRIDDEAARLLRECIATDKTLDELRASPIGDGKASGT